MSLTRHNEIHTHHFNPQSSGVNTMGKERKNSREGKKKAALSPKEKKAAKKAKKEAGDSFIKK